MNQTCRKAPLLPPYQTANGKWSTLYYVRFTDWQGVRRKFAVGDNLDDARDKLGELQTLNKGHYDWDAEKRKIDERRRRAVTFSQWGNTYFKDQLTPNPLKPGSADREKRAFALLEKFFGDFALVDVKKSAILEYRKKRTAEGVASLRLTENFLFSASS